MSSEVAICNLALSAIGGDNINAMSDAGTEAKACRQFYAHTRDLLLQMYPWRFAGKTAALAALVDNDKEGRWLAAYARPTDCLKVRWVRQAYSPADAHITAAQEVGNPYEIEGSTIYCNLSPAFLRYTYRLTDPTKFPPMFIEALAAALAVRLAMPITRDSKVRADMWQLAERTRAQAEMLDANEERETSDHDSDLVGGRE